MPRASMLLLSALLAPAAVHGLRVAPSHAPLSQTSRSPLKTPKPSISGEPAALVAGAVLLSIVEPASAGDVSWIAPTKLVLGPTLSIATIFFLLRVVLSWFPTYRLDEPPWNVVAAPTEPLLKPTRKLIPPVAGVDISPLVWVAFLSFISETLTGPQGLLTILEKKG